MSHAVESLQAADIDIEKRFLAHSTTGQVSSTSLNIIIIIETAAVVVVKWSDTGYDDNGHWVGGWKCTTITKLQRQEQKEFVLNTGPVRKVEKTIIKNNKMMARVTLPQ